jgi:hypothetical protein
VNFRRFALLVLSVTLSVTVLQLAACFIDPEPPNPHDRAQSETLPDASTDAEAKQ